MSMRVSSVRLESEEGMSVSSAFIPFDFSLLQLTRLCCRYSVFGRESTGVDANSGFENLYVCLWVPIVPHISLFFVGNALTQTIRHCRTTFMEKQWF
jgi:hypothetical protein